jgi:hypothetical protein
MVPAIVGAVIVGVLALVVGALIGQARSAKKEQARTAGAAAEVLLAELAVGEPLGRSAPPAHRGFDDLIADDEQDVARHQGVAAAGDLPVRRRQRALVGVRLGLPYGYPRLLEDVDEGGEVALARSIDRPRCRRPA